MTADATKLAEIEARVKAATQAPWEVCGYSPTADPSITISGPDEYVCEVEDGTGNITPIVEANAQLIAHAPSDLTYLLSELRQAREALTRIAAYPVYGNEPLGASLDMSSIAEEALAKAEAAQPTRNGKDGVA